MNIVKRKTRNGDKAYFSIEYGRNSGERMATGIFIYTRPKDQNNTRDGNRHLKNSRTQFEFFLKKHFIAPVDINEEFRII